MEDDIGAVAGGTEAQKDARAPRSQTLADFDQPSHAVFVVCVIDDDHAAGDVENIGAAGIAVGIQHKRSQTFDDRILGNIRPQGGGRRGHRVAEIMGGNTGKRDRHLLHRQQPVDGTARRHDDQRAIQDGNRSPTLRQRAADCGVIGIEGKQPGMPRRLPPHGEHSRVVGVQDIPAVRPGDPGDRRFDLRQLIERPDPILVEVIGRDIGDDGDVVVIGADPAQQDAATGRFQDGHGDPWLRQRHPRTTES